MREWEMVKETWLHRVNPSLKLAVALLTCIVVLFVRNLELMAFIGSGLLLLFLLFTGQPLKRILLLLIPFCAIFVSTASAMILFGNGQTLWFEWGLIRITEESFLRGMLIGLRALVFAVLGLTFALTTRPVNLFYSLMQQLRLDPKYAYSFMAALRLIPIMTEEFETIRNARKVRSGERVKGMQGILFKMKVYTIPLLSGSIRRAHRIAVAMEAKRFSGKESRTYYYDIGFSGNDVLFLAYMMMLGIVVYCAKEFF
ncbi:energy-coupling factor transporter transmembrane component T family protein [Trichococcus ilyis]|uniref:Abc/ecf transporter transmembrane component n=1 Tax=Trichococcus ilyis TaxID=640938 RepID=A0A143YYW2_9LACT|nr:energy-coupling factor transporter transmembrane component T [Trichococcus ilyis]CZQ99215.1 abc/ecf transporter transmembrane component [Trichococcus ilyis]SEJ14376.1 energy-coupling factor transport system permease protein [Trichococcus ilyis]